MAALLMTIDQATQALGISRSALWRRLRSGNIQSVRRGGRRLVQLPAVQKAPRVNVTGEIPPFTEDHPIFRIVGAGRGGGQPGARGQTRDSRRMTVTRGVLWDSSAILALLDANDADHGRAVQAARQIALARRPSFITNYIEVEAHALLLRKLGRMLARESRMPVHPPRPIKLSVAILSAVQRASAHSY
jgi:hypothetical protein